MTFRLGLAFWSGVLLLFLSGCDPKCREVKPVPEAMGELRERVDDALDDVDANDTQRVQIQKVFEANRPAVERLRKQVFPLQHALMAELRRDPPDRARLAALMDQHIVASTKYVYEFVDMMIAADAVLTSKQRKEMVERYTQPVPPFERSFLLDRAVDVFLLRIDANDEQKALVQRMLRMALDRGRVLQQRLEALRLEGGAEFLKDQPDRARVLSVVERGRALIRQMLFDVAGYYVLLQSKLEPRQRVMLGAELVRFEPCPATGPEQKTASR